MTDPYWTDGKRTIYHGDCREILPTLGKFDLLLTDPPYGIGAGEFNLGGYASSRIERSDWDDFTPDDDTISTARSCAESSVIWGGNYFNLPPSRCFLLWDKTSEMQGRSFAECEQAWCSWDAVPRIFRYAPTQMKKVHKTQKPLALMRWCISFAPNAKTILDPFMGSGTTLLAAKLEGLEAVGIELSEKYCEAAVKRLQQNTLDFIGQ